MRKLFLTAAAAAAAALLPLAAVAAPRDGNPSQRQAKQHLIWFAGPVSAVGSDSLTITAELTGKHDTQLAGQDVAAAVDSNTQILLGKDGSAGQLSDLQPGDVVGIQASASDATLASLTAARIHVWCNCHWLGGTIAALGSSSFAVQVAKTGPFDTVLNGTTVTLQVNGSTSYLGRKQASLELSDLAVGDRVAVRFAANGIFKAPGFDPTKATYTASVVHDLPKQAQASSGGTNP